MQKTVLSLSVAAALAVPTLALAQAAAPAVPTLDKVLEASGISMTGYIDAAYTHADRDIQAGFSPRVFDSYNNSFVLHQVGLQIAKQPKSGLGGLVNVTAGRDATIIHSAPDASTSTFDITQGYLQYAGGPLTVIGGKFTTLHGTEVIWSPSNANYSRSLLFGSVPFTHTGVRGTFAVGDTLNLIAGINNGWDQLVDANRGKTLELGVTATPIKPLSLAASYYGGEENSTITTLNGRRESFNFVASYAVIDPLSVGFEYLTVKQKDAVFDGAGGTKDGKYSGYALYLSYTFIPKWKLSLRAESLDDKDGFRFPGAVAAAAANGVTVSGTKHKEFTATVAFLAADNFELRGEVRQDKANEEVYLDNGSFKKTLMTYGLQGIYKF
ncbi:MAG TPA: outer membrane beta-barrel protein [Burkholderiales bacterium]|nr:outer membrane beta-barrel protein [Burkholderiales bacterium]